MLLYLVLAAIFLGIPGAAMAACFLKERQEHRARKPRTRCGSCNFNLAGHSNKAPCPECNSTHRIFAEPYRPTAAPWTLGSIAAIVIALPTVALPLASTLDPFTACISIATTLLLAPLVFPVPLLQHDRQGPFYPAAAGTTLIATLAVVTLTAFIEHPPRPTPDEVFTTALLFAPSTWAGLFGWALAIRTLIIVRHDINTT